MSYSQTNEKRTCTAKVAAKKRVNADTNFIVQKNKKKFLFMLPFNSFICSINLLYLLQENLRSHTEDLRISAIGSKVTSLSEHIQGNEKQSV